MEYFAENQQRGNFAVEYIAEDIIREDITMGYCSGSRESIQGTHTAMEYSRQDV